MSSRVDLCAHRSRYFPYNVSGITAVIEGYAEHDLPLNYVVLDIDWHKEPPESSECNLQRKVKDKRAPTEHSGGDKCLQLLAMHMASRRDGLPLKTWCL